MKRSILLLTAALFTLSAIGQDLKPQQVIASAGGYNVDNIVTPTISISWTLGETIIPSFTADGITLTHGFQQQLIVTTVEEMIEAVIKVTVFPNPANEVINIEFEEPVDGEIRLFLLNSQGKFVKTDVIEETTVNKQLNLQGLPAGLYYLKLVKGNLSNVYKVVKL